MPDIDAARALKKTKYILTSSRDTLKNKDSDAANEWIIHKVMSDDIISIMEMCHATGNRHLLWFEKLLGNHFEGIIAHATYDISAAKIEGINNKIKVIKRMAFGFHDFNYFRLKIFAATGNIPALPKRGVLLAA